MNVHIHKNYYRVFAIALAVAAMITIAVLVGAPGAKAQPCTPEEPYVYNGVCTGYGTYCNFGYNCSPVPNTPGTWNPSGYTPEGW